MRSTAGPRGEGAVAAVCFPPPPHDTPEYRRAARERGDHDARHALHQARRAARRPRMPAGYSRQAGAAGRLPAASGRRQTRIPEFHGRPLTPLNGRWTLDSQEPGRALPRLTRKVQMSTPYIPNGDAPLDTFLTNFSGLITAGPGTYGLQAGDASTIAGVVAGWHAAYLAATDGSTRGPMTIAEKDTQRVTCLSTVRPYCQQIANNGAVLTSDKIALGLNPRTNPPTPIATPTTQPVLSLSLSQPGQSLMRYRDSAASPSVKAKPFGAIACQVVGAVATTMPSNAATLPLLMTVTKSPFIVTWDPSDTGKTAYVAGRWITRTGRVGPFGAIVPVTVP